MGGLEIARDIMQAVGFVLRPGMSLHRAFAELDARGLQVAPVVAEDGRYLGMYGVHDRLRDVSAMVLRREPAGVVGDAMDRDVQSVDETTPVDIVIERMRRFRIGCLAVVDEGRLVGVVGQAELLIKLDRRRHRARGRVSRLGASDRRGHGWS